MNGEDEELMARAAWLYYLGGLNQEATAARLGVTRARVNKMLAEARESGLVSISIDHRNVGMLPLEDAIRKQFGLDTCVCTPAFGIEEDADTESEILKGFAFRSVGAAAANHLRSVIGDNGQAVIGIGWGRTIEQMTLQLTGLRAPKARFISLMGSLTANSASNPFDVVHSMARKTGAEGFFLPVPFIADSPTDRKVLLSQRTVVKALEIARSASLAIISVGELTEASLLRQMDMISRDQLDSLHACGAIGDTNGIFFDRDGKPVDHELNNRTIALSLEDLRRLPVVLLVAGSGKVEAAEALMRSGIANGLIIDGDAATSLAARLGHPVGYGETVGR